VARDGEGGLDAAVDAEVAAGGAAWVGKFLEGADDLADAGEALHGVVDGLGEFADGEVEAGGGFQAVDFGECGGGIGALFQGGAEGAVGGEGGEHALGGFFDEVEVVGDELGGGVDFVCDAGGEAADGFEFLVEVELDFHRLAVGLGLFLGGDVAGDAEGADEFAGAVAQGEFGGGGPAGLVVGRVGFFLDVEEGGAGLEDALFVFVGSARVAAGEVVEVGVADEVGRVAGAEFAGHEGVDAEEAALEVFEVNA